MNVESNFEAEQPLCPSLPVRAMTFEANDVRGEDLHLVTEAIDCLQQWFTKRKLPMPSPGRSIIQICEEWLKHVRKRDE